MSGERRDPVRVKIINTRYVQIDPMNFKSVVQSLTGKGSPVAATETDDSSSVALGRKASGPESVYGDWRSSGDLAVEELDRVLMMGLPPMDELQRLWTDQVN